MLSHLKCASVSFLIGLSVSACGSKPGDDPLINADQPELTSHLPGLPSNASSFLIGGIKGSGGDAVVCFANKDAQKTVREQLQSNNYPNANVNNPFKDPAISGAISSVELLDVFEFKLPSGFPGVIRGTVDIDTTFDKMAPRLIQRMAQKSRFGDKIAEALMQVPLENWRQAEGVLDINDSAQVFFIPSDCLLIQVAVRVDRQVFYDVNLWQKMDELSRTALVLHELVYKIGVDLKNHTDSQKTREVVGLLISKDTLTKMDGLQLYDRILGFGPFSFDWEVEKQAVEVVQVLSKHLSGELQDIIVTPTTLKSRGHIWALGQPSSTSTPNIRLAQSGVLSEILGEPVNKDQSVFWSSPGKSNVWLKFHGPDLQDFNLSTASSHSDSSFLLTAAGKIWTAKSAEFAGGMLKTIDGSGGCGIGKFNTVFGEVLGCRKLEFATDGTYLRAGAFRLKYFGRFIEASNASLDSAGVTLARIVGVQSYELFTIYSDIADSDSPNLTSKEVDVQISGKGLIMRADCDRMEPCTYRFSGDSSETGKIEGVRNYERVEDASGDIARVKTWNDGNFRNRSGSSEIIAAGNLWLRVNKEGVIRFE